MAVSPSVVVVVGRGAVEVAVITVDSGSEDVVEGSVEVDGSEEVVVGVGDSLVVVDEEVVEEVEGSLVEEDEVLVSVGVGVGVGVVDVEGSGSGSDGVDIGSTPEVGAGEASVGESSSLAGGAGAGEEASSAGGGAVWAARSSSQVSSAQLRSGQVKEVLLHVIPANQTYQVPGPSTWRGYLSIKALLETVAQPSDYASFSSGITVDRHIN